MKPNITSIKQFLPKNISFHKYDLSNIKKTCKK